MKTWIAVHYPSAAAACDGRDVAKLLDDGGPAMTTPAVSLPQPRPGKSLPGEREQKQHSPTTVGKRTARSAIASLARLSLGADQSDARSHDMNHPPRDRKLNCADWSHDAAPDFLPGRTLITRAPARTVALPYATAPG
jgi:hypothetical protein